MSFELGVYSFGNTPRTADGGHGPTLRLRPAPVGDPASA